MKFNISDLSQYKMKYERIQNKGVFMEKVNLDDLDVYFIC